MAEDFELTAEDFGEFVLALASAPKQSADGDKEAPQDGSLTTPPQDPTAPVPRSCEICRQLYDGETLPFEHCRYCGDTPSYHHGRCCPRRATYLYQVGAAARRLSNQNP